MRQHSPRLASRGAKLSRREKRWKRRVVEHSVLASTIVSREFLDLSATRIRFGRFLVCGPRTPFLPIAFWADLTKVRKASRAYQSPLQELVAPYLRFWYIWIRRGSCKALSCACDSCRTSGAAFAGLIVCRLCMSLGVDTTRFSKEERKWLVTQKPFLIGSFSRSARQ